jgi:hypothetical protein
MANMRVSTTFAEVVRMKEPPRSLPPANSRKWHSRRSWDGLGYLRVRSLANPAWTRDVNWLEHFLVNDRGLGAPAEREFRGAAVAAARRYPKTLSGQTSEEDSWDELLTAIDELLEVRQAAHIAAVKAAGASGIKP